MVANFAKNRDERRGESEEEGRGKRQTSSLMNAMSRGKLLMDKIGNPFFVFIGGSQHESHFH